VYKPHTS